MLDNLFLTILNMNLTASFVIIFVIIARIFIKKAPKIFSYALWSIVLFRLIFPFSFESVFSIIPSNTLSISNDIIYEQSQQINNVSADINNILTETAPNIVIETNHNQLHSWIIFGELIWLIGIAILLVYSVISYMRLKKQLYNAVHENNNIYSSEHLDTAFVMGIIRPKIYLPIILSQTEKKYIILHEQIHIRRFDHVVKLLSYLVLCVHWFNPLVWAAFVLCGKDMEMSCDEAVIKKLGNEVKQQYTSSLLTLATGRKGIGGIPLAFGEGDTKGRIKNVLNYKKPTFWIVIIATIAVISISIGLTANKRSLRELNGVSYRVSEIIYAAPMYSFSYSLDTAPVYSISSDYALYSKDAFDEEWLMKNGLYRYKISKQDLYKLFIPPHDIVREDINQVKTIYRADVNDENKTFYLVMQKRNGDVLLAQGYDDIGNYHIRWLFKLEQISDRNGFSLTDQEVAHYLDYSTAYCFSTYEMDGGLYIIGFLADGETKNSDIGACLFQYSDGRYKLISQTVHKGQALEQDRIAVGMLIAPNNEYYDIILSNNENLIEIQRTIGNDTISEKVSRVNPTMTVMKLPDDMDDITYIFYDEAGKHINQYSMHNIFILDDMQNPTEQDEKYLNSTENTTTDRREELSFWVKLDEPTEVIGETAAIIWLKYYKNEATSAVERIADYKINDITVITGAPTEEQTWEDMKYHYVVRMNYNITTYSDEYLSPGDGVSGKGTFNGLFRELCVRDLGKGNFEIVSAGTGGGEQEFLIKTI